MTLLRVEQGSDERHDDLGMDGGARVGEGSVSNSETSAEEDDWEDEGLPCLDGGDELRRRGFVLGRRPRRRGLSLWTVALFERRDRRRRGGRRRGRGSVEATGRGREPGLYPAEGERERHLV